MRRRTGAAAVAVTVLAGGLLLGPAVATAAPGSGGPAERVRDALQSLVDDGTLTGAQRDAVATRLTEELPPHGKGHGRHRGLGHGRGVVLDVAAGALGTTDRDLKDALRGGRSIADVAADRGVAVTTVVDALVADAERRLTTAVAEGRLTQAEADARRADLRERLTAAVERPGLGKGRAKDKGKHPGGGRD